MIKNLSEHPLQSPQWGEFRKKTGLKVIRKNGFQLSIHKVPHTPFNIGYLPKGPMPTKTMIHELLEIGKKEKCIFIQLEPNVTKVESKMENGKWQNDLGLLPAAHPLFTKYTLILDLTKSEEEILKNMHPKTRYNIKVALKHNVQVKEDNSDKAFEEYLRLTKETTGRQKFYSHDEKYHRLMWETLKSPNSRQRPGSPRGSQMENGKWKMANGNSQMENNILTAHLFLATYQPPGTSKKPVTLAAWILFVYKDTLYYPYGASSSKHREVMASNLMMWEAIKFGKKLGLKKFDMWGSLGPQPDPKDPWYGFHRFKLGYGPELVEFIGSYDLPINRPLYELYKISDKLRWTLLRLRS